MIRKKQLRQFAPKFPQTKERNYPKGFGSEVQLSSTVLVTLNLISDCVGAEEYRVTENKLLRTDAARIGFSFAEFFDNRLFVDSPREVLQSDAFEQTAVVVESEFTVVLQFDYDVSR